MSLYNSLRIARSSASPFRAFKPAQAPRRFQRNIASQANLRQPLIKVSIQRYLHNVKVSAPVLCGLIGANFVGFGIVHYACQENEHGDSKLYDWLARNCTVNEENLKAGRLWTLLTSSFVDASLANVTMNSLTLALCGPGLAACIGTPYFLSLYALASIGGSLWTQAAIRLFSEPCSPFDVFCVHDPTAKDQYHKTLFGGAGPAFGVASCAIMLIKPTGRWYAPLGLVGIVLGYSHGVMKSESGQTGVRYADLAMGGYATGLAYYVFIITRGRVKMPRVVNGSYI